MSAMADVARMLALVPWLLERPGASLAETATAFGVAEATIRRDLEHLDFCGLPGLGGGDLFEVSLVGDRIVLRMADELRRPLRPTPSEALRLVLTVDAVAAVFGDELPALVSGLAKVRRALGVPGDAVEVIAPAVDETVATVRRAVTGRRRLRLRYRSRGAPEPTGRDVDPWALRLEAGAWYLVGHDHTAGEPRCLRCDRIAELAVLDAPIAVPPPDELPSPRYEPGPDDLRVVLDAAPAGRWIADAVVLDQLEELPGGGARLHLRTDRPEWVAELVLMAGGEVRVVEPAPLADRVRERARSALRHYRDSAGRH